MIERPIHPSTEIQESTETDQSVLDLIKGRYEQIKRDTQIKLKELSEDINLSSMRKDVRDKVLNIIKGRIFEPFTNRVVNFANDRLFNTSKSIKDRVFSIIKGEEKEKSESTVVEMPISSEMGLKKNERGCFSVINKYGVTILENITHEEKDTLQKNPQMLGNLIFFKELLNDVNLNFVWDYRDYFLKAMKNEYRAINSKDDDYLSKEEVTKILNYILEIVGGRYKNRTLDSAIAEVRKKNGSGLDENAKNILDRSPIENFFWDHGYIDPDVGLNIVALQHKPTKGSHKSGST